MSKSGKLYAWQNTKPGLVLIILFDLLVAYGFASWAIDSGRLSAYFAAIVFVGLAIAQLVKLIKKAIHRG